MGKEKKIFWQRSHMIMIFAIICTMFWGSATPAIKIGYELLNISSNDIATKMVFAGIRFTFAGLILLMIFVILQKKKEIIKKEDCYPYMIMGILTCIQYICFYIGLTYTTGVKGSLFSATNGFIVVLVSPIIYKSEKLTCNKIIGCITAVIGLVCVTIGGEVQELIQFTIKGEGLVIAASLIHAISFYLTKEFARIRDPKLIAAWQLFIGGLLLWVIGAMRGGKITSFSIETFLIIAYLAMASALAFTFWNILMAYNKVSSVSMYNLFTPVFGILLSGLVLNEVILTWQNICALSLISLGIWLVNSSKAVHLFDFRMKRKFE